jgi:DNA-binding NtrC family response regulator
MNEQRFGKILIVDDNEDLLKAAKIFLKRHFAQVDTETNPDLLPILTHNESYDVILLDMNFTKDVSSGQEGFYWLDRILELDPAAVVVLITAYGDVNLAVKAIKEGATDFVLKPWENERLLATLNSALSLRQKKLEVNLLTDQKNTLQQDLDNKFKDIIGQSPAMQRIFETIGSHRCQCVDFGRKRNGKRAHCAGDSPTFPSKSGGICRSRFGIDYGHTLRIGALRSQKGSIYRCKRRPSRTI